VAFLPAGGAARLSPFLPNGPCFRRPDQQRPALIPLEGK
jgi:hypothetical protein